MTTLDTNNDTTVETSRRPRGLALGLTAALVALGAAGTGAVVTYSRTAPDPAKIAPGIKISDINVGGLTREEAEEKTRAWARSQLAKAVVLTAPKSEKKWAITLGELGGRFELASVVDAALQVGKDDNLFERLYQGNRERSITLTPEFKLDDSKLEAYLGTVAKAIRKPAQSARASMEGAKLVPAAREEKGVELDHDATKSALLKNGLAALADGETATLVVKEELPKVTAAELEQVTVLLGSYETDYGGSPRNRKINVGIASKKIDGTLLGPGEIFSYNTIVGPRVTEFGWKMAHQYQDGLVVDGIGGGVCQTSSTLYNAVLRADLKIVSRSNHSMPVRYVSAGRDATVSYDSGTDFKFANSTDGPIFVGAKADGDSLVFRIFGTKPPTRKVLSIYTGERRYTRSGYFSVTSYRRVQLPDGTIKTEVIDHSSYRPPREKPSR